MSDPTPDPGFPGELPDVGEVGEEVAQAAAAEAAEAGGGILSGVVDFLKGLVGR